MSIRINQRIQEDVDAMSTAELEAFLWDKGYIWLQIRNFSEGELKKEVAQLKTGEMILDDFRFV